MRLTLQLISVTALLNRRQQQTCSMLILCRSDSKQHLPMQESEYTTDGRDSHPSPAGTSRSDVSPQQLTAGSFLM